MRAVGHAQAWWARVVGHRAWQGAVWAERRGGRRQTAAPGGHGGRRGERGLARDRAAAEHDVYGDGSRGEGENGGGAHREL